jgi:chromosome segregation ATPase
VTEQEEQTRREHVAAVEVHERQVAAAQTRVDVVHRKIEQFDRLRENLEVDLKAAQENLAAEQEELPKVRARAEAALEHGPVTLNGEHVEALAGTASVAGSVN